MKMDKKGHSERLMTISYIAGEGLKCQVSGCKDEAEYMADGDVYCVFHWVGKRNVSLDKLKE